MAVRKPLYYDTGELKEMTTVMVDTIIDQCVYQYSLDPGVSLSIVASSGSVGSITDTRQHAGEVHTHNSSFPNEATTNEPSTVIITYDKIQQTISGSSPTSDTGWLWPAYKTSTNHIQAMNLQDVKDTFLHPAINLLTAATTTSAQAGTYHINTATSVGGSTLVSATPIFVNTQADPSQYSGDAAGLGDTENKSYASGGANGTNTVTMNNVTDITVGMTIWKTNNATLPDKTTSPTTITEINGNELTLSQNFTSQATGSYRIGGEAIDQPITITSYYLHKIDGVDSSTDIPLYLKQADNNLQSYTEANFKTYLQEWMKKVAAESGDGFKITYSYTTGTNRGSGMVDTILTGTGDYKTFQAGADDYRAQEFPNGTASTANTWYLKINKS